MPRQPTKIPGERTRQQAAPRASMVAASRTSHNGRYVVRSSPTDRQDRVCLSALQCSAPDDIPAVRIMPISFAQSNHHDVRVKLSSYGHIWSAISTFYLCIVRPRLAQLRALPTGARHSAPQQHVVLPHRLGVPPGCSDTPKCHGRVLGERTPGRLKARGDCNP